MVSVLYGVLQIRYDRYVISRPDYKEPSAPKFGHKTWEEHQSDKLNNLSEVTENESK